MRLVSVYLSPENELYGNHRHKGPLKGGYMESVGIISCHTKG
jgi:hypothetical protein